MFLSLLLNLRFCFLYFNGIHICCIKIFSWYECFSLFSKVGTTNGAFIGVSFVRMKIVFFVQMKIRFLQLQWLMVQLWNNGLGQADQGKKMEAVKMCNLALSVASRLSKWPGMLAYQKKMRHYFTSALASSSLSSPTPKTLFAD